MTQEGNSHPIPLPANGGRGSTPLTLREGVPRWNFDVTSLVSQNTYNYDTREH